MAYEACLRDSETLNGVKKRSLYRPDARDSIARKYHAQDNSTRTYR